MEKLKEIRKEMSEIEEKIAALKDDYRALAKKLREESPIKEGDKVEYEGAEYFAFEIVVDGFWANKSPIAVTLTSPKKDGTMPQKMLDGKYYVGIENLKKIEPARV